MSDLQQYIQRRSVAKLPGLNRFLLHCRFDFQEKAWSLPVGNIRSEAYSPADATAVAAAVGRNLPVNFTSSAQRVASLKQARRVGRQKISAKLPRRASAPKPLSFRLTNPISH
jgi:hypothetical protein